MQLSLADAVDGVDFVANTVRVVSSDSRGTMLLVGGRDNSGSNPYTAILLYISVTLGTTAYKTSGSVVLPSFNQQGVAALSQANDLHPGFVLASTNAGVFKCAQLCSSAL